MVFIYFTIDARAEVIKNNGAYIQGHYEILAHYSEV
jgi:hypothetical protein